MAMDSIDKIVESYFAAVSKHDFEYKGRVFKARPLAVSPLLLRGFTCPAMCGGCCYNVTLDYLPVGQKREDLTRRYIQFDGDVIEVWSDMQLGNTGKHCRHLDSVGRCGIYQNRPFPCDFELIRFMQFADKSRLTQQLHGRGWRMERVTGDRGSLCKMTPPDQATVDEAKRKLLLLDDWAQHFGVKTWVVEILDWIDQGAAAPLLLGETAQAGFFSG